MERTFQFETAEESTGFLLWQVTNLWHREIKKVLEPYDLTHAQFVLLASILWLTKEGKAVNQILLSTHSKIDPMTTSTVLRTLQAKNMLQRQEHATDTRAKTVGLTEIGLETTLKAIKVVEDFDNSFFKPLDEDTFVLNRLLRRLLKSAH